MNNLLKIIFKINFCLLFFTTTIFASGNHVADMIFGGQPSSFLFSSELFTSGKNVLAPQVHNVASDTSDLSSNLPIIIIRF